MTNKLFVGSLDYATTDEQLKEHFSKVGNVISAKVIIDRMTGQGKGFGFVEMSNAGEAQRAIQELSNSNLSGRNIVVNEAKPQANHTGGNFKKNKNNFQSRKNRW